MQNHPLCYMLAWRIWMYKLLQKLPWDLMHLHVFLWRRTQTRGSSNFVYLLTYPWHLRCYETGFFSSKWCNFLLSFILQMKNTKRDLCTGAHELKQWIMLIMPFPVISACQGACRKLEWKNKGEKDVYQYTANYKTPIFTNNLENNASFNYCPVHLQIADLSLCLSPWDANSCQRRLRMFLVLYLCITVIYVLAAPKFTVNSNSQW